MPRKIAENGVGDVHVQDPETGAFVVLHPGDEVPDALDSLVGAHCTTGRRTKTADPSGPGQLPGDAAKAAAAQKAVDAKAEADKDAQAKAEAEKKAAADAAALAAAQQAEAEKKAAADAAGTKA